MFHVNNTNVKCVYFEEKIANRRQRIMHSVVLRIIKHAKKQMSSLNQTSSIIAGKITHFMVIRRLKKQYPHSVRKVDSTEEQVKFDWI